MKHWFLFLPLILLYCLTACNHGFDADIEAIKKTPVPTNLLVSAFFSEVPNEGASTIDAGISQLAGVAGSSKWSAYRSEKYKDNPDVVCVDVEVKCLSDKVNHTAKFQWLLNRKTEHYELLGFEVDGKKQSSIDAIMALRFGVLPQDGNETPPKQSVLTSQSSISPPTTLDEVKTFLEGWSESQSNKDLNKYLTLYSSDFQGIKRTKSGKSTTYNFQQWAKDRSKMYATASNLSVSVADIKITTAEDSTGVITVEFLQAYSSDKYSDRGRKLMRLKRDEGELKIVFEEMLYSIEN